MEKAEFKIIVTKEGDKAKVEIGGSPETEGNFYFWMCACEYFLATTARQSNAGFEKAMELLCKGAMTYKNI